MRLFQNSGLSGAYRSHLAVITAGLTTFDERIAAFITDRYGASHFLKPVLDHDPNAFLTNGDDAVTQRVWARERGLRQSVSMEEILLTQIEEHRTDVFYNMDPVRYDSKFVKKMPSGVKSCLCWRAAPSPGADFRAYDLVLCNFPFIIESWRRQGYRSEYFAPAHDPIMDNLAGNHERTVDVTFVGTYSRHHKRRARILESVAGLADEFRIVLSLDQSRLNRLSESALGILPGLRAHRRPASIRRTSSGPVFGMNLYRALSNSKIVLNGAIDMSGNDRGNMRCFEAMGCGALLVSDSGRYPSGMVNGETMIEYDSPDDVENVIRTVLANWSHSEQIARRGSSMIRSVYGKAIQWQKFQLLL
ncbi:glycosyltransferase [soil metagenome]